MSSQKVNMAYLNGKLVPRSEAKVSCFDEGVTHGWAVYEGLRVYNGKILTLDEHVNRLYDSAKAAYIDIPLSREEFKKAIVDTVKANGYRECHIRPWVSYGEHGGKPNVFIQVSPRGTAGGMGKGKKALVSAPRGGARNAREGNTRETLMELLRKDGYQVEEKNMTFKDLYAADEIFSCGTGEEINPIVEVDGRAIGDGKTGPIVKRPIEIYKSWIGKEGKPI